MLKWLPAKQNICGDIFHGGAVTAQLLLQVKTLKNLFGFLIFWITNVSLKRLEPVGMCV